MKHPTISQALIPDAIFKGIINLMKFQKAVKYNKKIASRFLIVALAAMLLGATSCKSDPEEEIDPYLIPANVAVTSFSLTEDDNVLANLDSVFFSIDLKNRVIFNADSLPVGTKINKLIPVIEYSSYVNGATITMEEGETRTGEVNYIESPTDSIDFTGKVTLTLSVGYADGDTIRQSYRVKVLVHKENTDSLIWGDKAFSKLPSRLENPKNQKSIDFKGMAVSLIEESDGTYTYATSSNLYDNTWNKIQESFTFVPDVRSLTATDRCLNILDKDGNLYESTDGSNWTSVGEKWISIIGAYKDTAIGLKQSSNGLSYAQYPLKNLNASQVDPEFPVSGTSNFVILENKWTTSPVGFCVGGKLSNGKLSDATWAFDGANWVKLTEGGIPNVEGASLIPYYNYRNTQSTWSKTEYNVWMVIGGTKADGTMNRTVYISYDNGVNWDKGNEQLQLPEEIPALTGCDNVVMYSQKKAAISDYWTRAGGSTPSVDGDNILWECPYIYLLGGMNESGKLQNSIWRGALARFTFTPII